MKKVQPSTVGMTRSRNAIRSALKGWTNTHVMDCEEREFDDWRVMNERRTHMQQPRDDCTRVYTEEQHVEWSLWSTGSSRHQRIDQNVVPISITCIW
jgi:hypothetical protein